MAKSKKDTARFSVRETKHGHLVFTSDSEILGSSISKEQAEMIVSALNGGDVTALKRWRRSPDAKKAHYRLREEADNRLAAA